MYIPGISGFSFYHTVPSSNQNSPCPHLRFFLHQEMLKLDKKRGELYIVTHQSKYFKFLHSINFIYSGGTKRWVKLVTMSIKEFKLGGISRGKLIEFFVTRKYLIRSKESFTVLPDTRLTLLYGSQYWTQGQYEHKIGVA